MTNDLIAFFLLVLVVTVGPEPWAALAERFPSRDRCDCGCHLAVRRVPASDEDLLDLAAVAGVTR